MLKQVFWEKKVESLAWGFWWEVFIKICSSLIFVVSKSVLFWWKTTKIMMKEIHHNLNYTGRNFSHPPFIFLLLKIWTSIFVAVIGEDLSCQLVTHAIVGNCLKSLTCFFSVPAGGERKSYLGNHHISLLLFGLKTATSEPWKSKMCGFL